MEKDVVSIKTFPREHFDPTAALVQALEKIEALENQMDLMREEMEEIKIDLAGKSQLLYNIRQQQLGSMSDTDLRHNRAKVLEALLKDAGGQMRQQDAMITMNLTASQMSKLVGSLKATVGQCPDPTNASFKMIYLRNFLNTVRHSGHSSTPTKHRKT